MLEPIRIEEIDQLLNELERLAQTEQSRQRFLQLLLDRLRILLHASGTALALPHGDGHWLWIASSGDFSANVARLLPPSRDLHRPSFHAIDNRLLAVPVPSDSGPAREQAGTNVWRRGGLAVTFAQPTTTADAAEICKLLSAFAEVLGLRQSAEAEQFLSTKWTSLQAALISLSKSQSFEEYATTLVNDLATLMVADRVSLVGRASGKGRVVAISGVVEPRGKSDTVRAIARVGANVLLDGQALCWRSTDDDTSHQQSEELPPRLAPDRAHLAANVLGLAIASPLIPKPASQEREPTKIHVAATTMLLLEWQDDEAFVAGCSTLQHIFPSLVASWQQQTRWLALPRVIRLALNERNQFASPKRITKRLAKLALLAAIVGGLVWCLSLPTPLRIETRGALQPVNQRLVFAALDGVVERVLVDDGQSVEAGELLAELRSPMLEIQLQETLGEMQANTEKRDGLNVAINQVASDDPQAFSRQSRLSGEIRELETQMATLQDKREALALQRERLQIVAPISGSIVARDIDQRLLQRPVRRGDALLRIVQLDGPWQLELLVADRDSGYVRRQLFAGNSRMAGDVSQDNPAQKTLEYVIAAEPSQPRFAQATWLAEAARNPRGDGVYVDLFASTESLPGTKSHMGATVHAYLACGTEPFWFVWTRPLVEAIQRNLWF